MGLHCKAFSGLISREGIKEVLFIGCYVMGWDGMGSSQCQLSQLHSMREQGTGIKPTSKASVINGTGGFSYLTYLLCLYKSASHQRAKFKQKVTISKAQISHTHNQIRRKCEA